jgi:hypothetical protein
MPDRYTNTQGEVRWRARWRTGSGERHVRRGFRSEQEARAHEEAMRTTRRQGKPLRRPKTRMSVNDYWERWWSEEVTVAKARATQYSYRDTYLGYIAPTIGRAKLRELIDDPQRLMDWRSKLAKDKSRSAVAHAHRVLSSMLSAAAEDGVIPHNPLLLPAQQGRRGGRVSWAVQDRSRRGRSGRVVPCARVPAPSDSPAARRARGAPPPVRPRPTARCTDRRRRLMAGLRLPSEALALTRCDLRRGRL